MSSFLVSVPSFALPYEALNCVCNIQNKKTKYKDGLRLSKY